MSNSADVPRIGDPWPDAAHGEVRGPDGTRAYDARTAASLLGLTPRWATRLATDQTVSGRKAQVPGRRGAHPWFLDADEFEAHCTTLGLWPPGDPDEVAGLRASLRSAEARAAEAEHRAGHLAQSLSNLQRRHEKLLHELDQVVSAAGRTGAP